jgi:recombination protein RecR
MSSPSLDRLIQLLGRLPGFGRRSAERAALRLARDGGLAEDLALALAQVRASVVPCSRCGNLTERTQNPCFLCLRPGRDERLLCVVEEADHIRLVEASGAFAGRYFCLNGKLSPAQTETVTAERMRRLIERIRAEGVQELLLALNSDVESDATAAWLHDTLAPIGLRISRLAFGLPAGSALQYADPLTLARAIQGRQSV